MNLTCDQTLTDVGAETDYAVTFDGSPVNVLIADQTGPNTIELICDSSIVAAGTWQVLHPTSLTFADTGHLLPPDSGAINVT